MFVVVVDFHIHPEHVEAFSVAIRDNARASVEDEPGCHQFDVCVAPNDPAHFFLYELYTDRAAFDAHLAAPHFLAFDRLIKPWVRDKVVRQMQRIEPA